MIRRLMPWILLLVVGLFVYFGFFGKKDARDSMSADEVDSASAKRTRLTSKSRVGGDQDASPRGIAPSTVIRELIETAVGDLWSSGDPENSRQTVAVLKERFESFSDGQAAAAAIADFLKSGQDVSTGLAFSVGSEGVMRESPSLRIVLLDLLPSLDPSLALRVAREIMDDTESADEYAVCLRNLAWNDCDGDLRSELSERFERMLKTKDWTNQPTAGFLEAMDVAVELSDLRQFRHLTGLMGNPDRAGPELQRATSIALDRMVLRNPSLLVESFAADPLLNDLPPILRASLLSRLDITKADEREVFSAYLEAGNHGEGELEYFGNLFPNGNYVQGHRLITKDEQSLSIEARLAEDLKVLNELEKRGSNVPETILRIRDRLRKLTGSWD